MCVALEPITHDRFPVLRTQVDPTCGTHFSFRAGWQVGAQQTLPAPGRAVRMTGGRTPDTVLEERVTMKELFAKFLQSPDRESYLAVRAALVASEHYDPYSREFNTIEELIDAGKLADALEQLMAAMPNLLLSPKAH
jgi:hypothetical protein